MRTHPFATRKLPAPTCLRDIDNIDNMTELIGSALCVACQSIFQPNTVRNDSGEVAHHDLEALAVRAGKCHLCLTIFMSIDPEAYRNFRRGSTVNSTGFAWFSPIARDQARLKFRYVKQTSVDRATPTTHSSKTSMTALGGAGLVVELILMNPKCELIQDVGGVHKLTRLRCCRTWREDH